MLPPDERDQIRVWSGAEIRTPIREAGASWSSVHDAFERQATETPTNPAVRFGHQQLTYHELSRRSNPARAVSVTTGSQSWQRGRVVDGVLLD